MHWIAELLREWLRRVVVWKLLVARHAAVGAPMALVGAGCDVEHDDPAVAIAVGDEHLVRDRIELHVRGAAELRLAVAAFGLPFAPDLRDELPGRREFQDLVVFRPVAADPDVAFG